MQPVRGTQDILPLQSLRFRRINDVAFAKSKTYGFGELNTPIFEFTDVFQKTLGDTSDIVNKEMYTFLDRGGDSITLRPEGTAGIARAFISNGLAQNLPLKFYYFGPMFRYERPQKGRYRQFHQMGIELLGYETPWADVECLSLAYDVLKELGLLSSVQLEINTLGDQQSRQNYRQKIVDYFTPFKQELSADSQLRLEKNPLRILDSKDEKDKKLIAGAPKMSSCLSTEAQAFFDKVLGGLTQLGINYFINEQLVRGLDYYCHTVFEFTTTSLGAQGTVLAGGRYDGLISMMGGPQTPGVGWASGIERLSLMLEQAEKLEQKCDVAMIAADEKAEALIMQLAHELRAQNFVVEIPFTGNLGKKFKKADKLGAEWAVVVGETELQAKTVSLKNLKTGEQRSLPQAELAHSLKR